MRARALALAAGLAATTACSSSAPAPAAPVATRPAATSAAPSAAALPPLAVDRRTVWLCRPGTARNPCEAGLDATVLPVQGGSRTERFRPATQPPVDCFYVYPTVSRAAGDNAPLRSSPEVVATARAQAARFAGACRLFVPVYRQATVAALLSGRFFAPEVQALADADVRSAWHDYLLHDNGGRGVVLIGHSQGAMVLERLVAAEVEGVPAVRDRVVSALLLGGNVTVAGGKDTGGTFRSLPACRAAGQTGCVVAYSTYAATPPPGGLFGRTTGGLEGLCTDPTVLAGHPDALEPYLPSDRLSATGSLTTAVPARTGFVAYPGSLRASCRATPGFSWLQVSKNPGARTPALPQTLGPAWGLHVGDVNLALGDLVRVVQRQSAAWTAAH